VHVLCSCSCSRPTEVATKGPAERKRVEAKGCCGFDGADGSVCRSPVVLCTRSLPLPEASPSLAPQLQPAATCQARATGRDSPDRTDQALDPERTRSVAVASSGVGALRAISGGRPGQTPAIDLPLAALHVRSIIAEVQSRPQSLIDQMSTKVKAEQRYISQALGFVPSTLSTPSSSSS
jgi:hypothetical protein